MRVLVCGTRTYTDRDELFRVLDLIDDEKNFDLLIEGGARGADTLAGEWAIQAVVPVALFEADWKHYGRAAGPIRNRQMLDEGKPDLVVAFVDKPLAETRGTANMVNQAMAAGVKVRVYGP